MAFTPFKYNFIGTDERTQEGQTMMRISAEVLTALRAPSAPSKMTKKVLLEQGQAGYQTDSVLTVPDMVFRTNENPIASQNLSTVPITIFPENRAAIKWTCTARDIRYGQVDLTGTFRTAVIEGVRRRFLRATFLTALTAENTHICTGTNGKMCTRDFRLIGKKMDDLFVSEMSRMACISPQSAIDLGDELTASQVFAPTYMDEFMRSQFVANIQGIEVFKNALVYSEQGGSSSPYTVTEYNIFCQPESIVIVSKDMGSPMLDIPGVSSVVVYDSELGVSMLIKAIGIGDPGSVEYLIDIEFGGKVLRQDSVFVATSTYEVV